MSNNNENVFGHRVSSKEVFWEYFKAILSGKKKEIYSHPEIYDAMVNGLLGRENLALGVADVIEKSVSKNSSDILDLAAGSGVLSVELAKRGFNVTSVDYNYLALRSLQTKVKNQNIKPISTLQLDFNASQWPFQPESFDVVTSLRANRYITDFSKWLSNVYLLLRTNGILVLPIFAIDFFAWKKNSNKGFNQETSASQILNIIKKAGFTVPGNNYLSYDKAIYKDHLDNKIPFFYKPTFIIASK